MPKAINLFIDTNIFLNCYQFSVDDLEKLDKLHSFLEADKIRIFIPKQVIDEFYRNRESKIKESLKHLHDFDSGLYLPRICDKYEEADKINKSVKIIKKLKPKLNRKIEIAIKQKKLKADEVISRIFGNDRSLDISDDLIKKARRRLRLGNPPGVKNNSCGDAVIWEFLLEQAPFGEDLYFISDNKRDFCSSLNEMEFAAFLQDEWYGIKRSKIIYHNNLSDFFKKKFPSIKITDEDVKDAKIKRFANSADFKGVRHNLSNLSEIKEFSVKQINDIVNASISNGQITRCQQYSPWVGKALKGIVDGYRNKINPENYKIFRHDFANPIKDKDSIDKTLDDILRDL
ncbi:DUF4935 domain-containing protein [Patescibacteria group bacterium]|nr:DUF4935 domain-containing protein [Patescibacteria group bacterium]